MKNAIANHASATLLTLSPHQSRLVLSVALASAKALVPAINYALAASVIHALATHVNAVSVV